MAAPKGHKRWGGRKKGTTNKATATAKEAIAHFIDGNAHKLQGWLEAIEASDGPKAAATLFVDLIEFAVPKLARTELTGEGGGAIIIQSTPLDDAL